MKKNIKLLFPQQHAKSKPHHTPHGDEVHTIFALTFLDPAYISAKWGIESFKKNTPPLPRINPYNFGTPSANLTKFKT